MTVRFRDLYRALDRAGFVRINKGKCRHFVYVHPDTGMRVTLSMRPQDTPPDFVLSRVRKAILEATGEDPWL